MSVTTASTSTLRAGVTTQLIEVADDELELSGTLPPWLAGSLLRTGPGRFETADGAVRHWFDGMAKLHRFTIDDGKVSYGNRYLHSRNYRAAEEQVAHVRTGNQEDNAYCRHQEHQRFPILVPNSR